MGKILIVYYSLEGNTKLIADKLGEALSADVLALKPVKSYPTGKVTKFLWGGKSAVMADTPKLQPYDRDLSKYDTIILGTPIWASSITPPLRTFLKENDIKDKHVAGYACCAGGKTSKAFDQMEDLSGTKLYVFRSIVDPRINKLGDVDEIVAEFAGAIRMQ